jgi:hypothetical protein
MFRHPRLCAKLKREAAEVASIVDFVDSLGLSRPGRPDALKQVRDPS